MYDEGFEYEQVINFSDLPDDKKEIIIPQIQGAQKVIYEEVFALNQHSYEVYVTKDGKFQKIDF